LSTHAIAEVDIRTTILTVQGDCATSIDGWIDLGMIDQSMITIDTIDGDCLRGAGVGVSLGSGTRRVQNFSKRTGDESSQTRRHLISGGGTDLDTSGPFGRQTVGDDKGPFASCR
jgi:hypothetical protein